MKCLLILLTLLSASQIACSEAMSSAEEKLACVNTTSTTSASIEEIIKEGGQVTEKSGAGAGGAIGAAAAGGTALITGGISIPLAAIGGGAVGGAVGSASGSEVIQATVTTCRFRVMYQGLPYVYYGDKDGDYEDAFEKCTMLRIDDPLIIERVTACYRNGEKTESYYWRSGPTYGPLR